MLLRRALTCNVFTTDVNSSAYGEVVARNNAVVGNLVYYAISYRYRSSALSNVASLLAVLVTLRWVIIMARHPMDGYPFPYGCLKCYAAGPSLEARTGVRGENIELNNLYGMSAIISLKLQ